MAVTVMTKNNGNPLVIGLVGVSIISYRKRMRIMLVSEYS